MTNFIKRIFISSFIYMIIGCSTTNGSVAKQEADQDNHYTSLVQILRGKPSLKISGSGADYIVMIRGERSFFDNNEPLYMLDDVVIGNTYKEAASGIDPSEITSAEVITPANAGRFGSRGGNGVIVFRSKRKR